MGVPEDLEGGPTAPAAPAPEAAPASWFQRWVIGTGRREATERMGVGQAAYVLGFHGVGSLVISGGVNFGIACAMYTHPKDPITLLRLPNTLAGDAALTIIIQTLVTWVIEWLSVCSDLRAGKVAPLAYAPSSPRVRRILGVPELAPRAASETGRETPSSQKQSERGRDTPSTHKHSEQQQHQPQRQQRLSIIGHVIRIILLLVPSFILIWPPSLAILTTVGTKVGSDYVFESRWAPQVFKLVLGGVLGLLVTPFMALFWVMREGLA